MCKLRRRKFHLNARRHFFTCEGGQTLKQVAKRGCEVPVCGDIQNLIGHGPGQPAVADHD